VCVPARDREQLERLCRYVARPAVASERLSLLPSGRVYYQFKKVWRDGSRGVELDPVDFVAKLAALVPRPRVNLVHYHGVFAPGARLRARVVALARPRPQWPPPRDGDLVTGLGLGLGPGPAAALAAAAAAALAVSRPVSAVAAHLPAPGREQRTNPSEGAALPSSPEGILRHPREYSWSELLARVFAIDVLRCPCGARMTVLASITSPTVAKKILAHLGIDAGPREPWPARGPPDLDDAPWPDGVDDLP
jgi:hypothetical protein